MAEQDLDELRALYARMRTIAVVGCSSDRLKPGSFVPRYLRAYGYRIVPVNPARDELFGSRCVASLLEIEDEVDVVQVFRPAQEAPGIAADAVAIGAGCLWLQLGIESVEAARIARAGGLAVVMDRCMGVVHGQLGLGPGLHLGDEWHRGLDPGRAHSPAEQPVLRGTAGPASGHTIPTTGPLVIGREGEDAGRIADDPELSRVHARVRRDRHDQVVIEDLGSVNGTYVNGARVSEQVLAVGDVVQVGACSLELTLPAAPARAVDARDRASLAAVSGVHAIGSLLAASEQSLRAEFPVFERAVYMNAGSDGPAPRRALEAAAARIGVVLDQGRASDVHARQLRSIEAALRSAYAGVLGASPNEVALTRATHDGINTVLCGLHLRRRDEILTSDEEHLSLLAPLAAVAKRFGVDVRTVPFDELAGAVGPRTRLVACSHVSWITGRVADVPAIVAAGAPVLLDGAQALGAIPVDVTALGCDYYAASGQKWLCGPEGTGCLYVRGDRQRTLSAPWPSALTVGEATRGADIVFHAEARRFDTTPVIAPLATWALAALEVLAEAGFDWVLERGPSLAATLADGLAGRGLDVAPRGPSTLVSWSAADPERVVARLAEHSVVVRGIVDRGLVRASVGAWNSAEDVERLTRLAA
jgi:L-cysteine/cystine lyase